MRPFVGITLTLAVVSCACAQVPLNDALVSLDFAPGWTLEGAVNQYDKDNLYTYIDGEAEFFFPFGFELLHSARYVKSSEKASLVADVYRMGSPLDAFGVYSNYRRPETPVVPIGAEGVCSATQCLFYQDRYYVQISVSGADKLPQDVFTACAKAIATKLPGDARPPNELDLLRVEGVVPRSERYLAKSLLGYSFFRKGLIADAAWDSVNGRVFVVLEDSKEKAAAVLDQYAEYLKKSNLTPKRTPDTLSATDPLYKGVLLRQAGSRVFGVINPGDPDKGASLMRKLAAVK